MAAENIPDSGAIFVFGKSKIPDYSFTFWIRNDPVLQVAAGDEHSAFITTSGRLFTFGSNNWGQLGLGHTNYVEKPALVKTLTHERSMLVACGRSHTLVATDSKSVYGFGANGDGQITGAEVSYTTPAVITFPNEIHAKMLAAGSDHSMLLTDKGLVYVWGSNAEGQLGLGDKVEKTSNPSVLKLDAGVIHIAAGYYHSALIDAEGCVHMFGEKEEGKLGLPESLLRHHHKPQPLRDFEAKAVWVACGGSHSAILTVDGKVYTFGDGSSGQLGLGTRILSSSTPAQVSSFNEIKVARIYCGDVHTIFLTDSGQVYACGDERHGKLGLHQEDSYSNIFQPTLLADFFDFQTQQVACGGCHTIMISAPLKDKNNSDRDKTILECHSVSSENLCEARQRRRQKKKGIPQIKANPSNNIVVIQTPTKKAARLAPLGSPPSLPKVSFVYTLDSQTPELADLSLSASKIFVENNGTTSESELEEGKEILNHYPELVDTPNLDLINACKPFAGIKTSSEKRPLNENEESEESQQSERSSSRKKSKKKLASKHKKEESTKKFKKSKKSAEIFESDKDTDDSNFDSSKVVLEQNSKTTVASEISHESSINQNEVEINQSRTTLDDTEVNEFVKSESELKDVDSDYSQTNEIPSRETSIEEHSSKHDKEDTNILDTEEFQREVEKKLKITTATNDFGEVLDDTVIRESNSFDNTDSIRHVDSEDEASFSSSEPENLKVIAENPSHISLPPPQEESINIEAYDEVAPTKEELEAFPLTPTKSSKSSSLNEVSQGQGDVDTSSEAQELGNYILVSPLPIITPYPQKEDTISSDAPEEEIGSYKEDETEEASHGSEEAAPIATSNAQEKDVQPKPKGSKKLSSWFSFRKKKKPDQVKEHHEEKDKESEEEPLKDGDAKGEPAESPKTESPPSKKRQRATSQNEVKAKACTLL